MREIIDKLKLLYPDYEESEKDLNIIEVCIDGIYTEKDFFHAVKILFNRSKKKVLKPFENKNIFIKFRNIQIDLFPSWINDLTNEDQEALKDIYRDIVRHCFKEHEYYKCQHSDLFKIIYDKHKTGIPYWCILAVIEDNIDTYQKEIKKPLLIEFLTNGDYFHKLCQERFKKRQEFLKSFKSLDQIGCKLQEKK